MGLIGVGNMGKGIARNLLLKGPAVELKELHVFDTSRQNIVELTKDTGVSSSNTRLVELSSFGDLLSKVDFVALSLPSEKICHNVLFHPSTGIITGYQGRRNSNSTKVKVIIDHGTNSRDFAVECAERTADLTNSSVYYIDAPVSGGPQGAQNGTLTVMMGGNQIAIESVEFLLSLYSAKQIRFGDTGTGAAAKLINQTLVGIHALAACEALRMAKHWNLQEIELLKQMLSISWGQSKVLDLVLADYLEVVQQTPSFNQSSQLNDLLKAIAHKSTGAPLRNMEKDFNCIVQALPVMNKGKEENQGMSYPLTKITDSMIKSACTSEKGLKDAPFLGLFNLLQ